MKYSNADYEKLKHYHNYVSQCKATYLDRFQNFMNYQFKLADMFTDDELTDLCEKHYPEWERYKNLYHLMLVSRADLEKALRELYNFTIILREFYKEIGQLKDSRNV